MRKKSVLNVFLVLCAASSLLCSVLSEVPSLPFVSSGAVNVSKNSCEGYGNRETPFRSDFNAVKPYSVLQSSYRQKNSKEKQKAKEVFFRKASPLSFETRNRRLSAFQSRFTSFSFFLPPNKAPPLV